MAAPTGNINSKKGRLWAAAIKRALAKHFNTGTNDALDQLALKLVVMAANSDKWAIDHIADRIDGKAPQSVELYEENPNQGTEVSNIERARRIVFLMAEIRNGTKPPRAEPIDAEPPTPSEH